nr:2OG-Fe(II) oxygenase family protein [uncultured Lichenicoccus sp.]
MTGVPDLTLLDLDRLSPSGFVEALQRSSCVLVRGRDVPVDAAEAVFASGRKFMERPDSEKAAVAWPGHGAWQGWQRMQGDDPSRTSATYLDLVERFELRLAQRSPDRPPPAPDDVSGLAAWAESFTLWPAEPEAFSATWTRSYARMHRFASQLVTLLADGLDLRAGLQDWTVRQWSNLVLNHYPPQHAPPEAGRVRSRPHTDIGGFTLLWSNDRTGGLEARASDRSWRTVDIPQGTLLIQAGDLLTRWTRGRIPSNLHRVVNPPAGSEAARNGRYSVVYFHHPDMGTTITGEDGRDLVASEHVRRRQRLETPVA